MRITGQLIEGVSGRHLWADKFDYTGCDPFELQDRLAERVVGAMAPQLEKAEMDRVKREPTGNPAAYDLYLRGLASWNRWSKDDNADALTFFYAAIEKDPDFATPYGLAASCYQFAKANGWHSDFDLQEISRLTECAAELGSDDAVALCWDGHGRAFFFNEVERALLLIDRALELDVNLATAWQRRGWVCGYAGEHQEAIRSLERAMRLDPLDPRVFLTQSAMAFAHFIAARDQEASDWAAKAAMAKPNWLPALRVTIAANAMLGRIASARDGLKAYERIDPDVNIRKSCGHYPFQRAKDESRGLSRRCVWRAFDRPSVDLVHVRFGPIPVVASAGIGPRPQVKTGLADRPSLPPFAGRALQTPAAQAPTPTRPPTSNRTSPPPPSSYRTSAASSASSRNRPAGSAASRPSANRR